MLVPVGFAAGGGVLAGAVSSTVLMGVAGVRSRVTVASLRLVRCWTRRAKLVDSFSFFLSLLPPVVRYLPHSIASHGCQSLQSSRCVSLSLSFWGWQHAGRRRVVATSAQGSMGDMDD